MPQHQHRLPAKRPGFWKEIGFFSTSSTDKSIAFSWRTQGLVYFIGVIVRHALSNI
jgi:hypothetical protein